MEHPRSPRGYTYIMTYWKGIRQLAAENVSNPLAKAQRVWYNADTMLDTIFLWNQRNERKNRVKMDCLAPCGANNAERQKSGNNINGLQRGLVSSMPSHFAFSRLQMDSPMKTSA